MSFAKLEKKHKNIQDFIVKESILIKTNILKTQYL